ncbi:MAG: hypothetical protein K1X67_06040 [Fimbriimonadaceae bacterium]|nr:hypothetical protein [Fimbriimonadaceae bacterium]
MIRVTGILQAFGLFFGISSIAVVTLVVPNEIQQPGTQPQQVSNLESPDRCDNCHGGYDPSVEPAHNWRGSMMANAGRDPIFWATLAVAEKDVGGVGDLCLRCHSTSGWLAGNAVPSDGSGLLAGDSDGVDCDTCHKMTNPNNREHLGTMTEPFIANDRQTPATGFYGTGMLSIWSGAHKLGPYTNPEARHQFLASSFHRSVDFCGSCHDVSNPLVGDLAHNSGKQPTGDPVAHSGTPGGPLSEKASFRNFPFMYGVVERTFSEFKAGALSRTLVSQYSTLPSDLREGAIRMAYESAQAAGRGGNYEDNSPRYFSCQTCHVRPVTGKGCNKAGVPTRTDLPLHDMTGGSSWTADAILFQNQQGTLRLGGGLTAGQISAITAGKDRAEAQLEMAAGIEVVGNKVKVINRTGHKLISGYPEGRRMWLNMKWYDALGSLIREDGKYGPIMARVNGQMAPVDTLLDLDDPNTKVYEAHYGITQEWAAQLVGIGIPPDLALTFDRITGDAELTLGELAAMPNGTVVETFHFVLNNTVVKDNRIPPYGMTYEEARKRNALPVPATQYGAPTGNQAYRYWDEVDLLPPPGAIRADVSLLYQTTSWEYIQFLNLANEGTTAFLANEGRNLLDAWLGTGMSPPVTMASTTWTGRVITGSVDLNDYEGSLTLPQVVFEIRNVGGSASLETITSYLAPVGEYVLSTGLPAGTYDIACKPSHWLRQKRGSVTISANGAVNVDFTCVNGDCDGDNEVGIGDYAMVSGAYNTAPGDATWNPSADLNGDEAVDIADYAILSAHYGEVGDE